MQAYQSSNQNGEIELADGRLQKGEGARRRGCGGDIPITQCRLGNKAVVYEIANICGLGLCKDGKTPGEGPPEQKKQKPTSIQ
jgi:hypothetical protein